ncbi:MAG: YfdX family protein [Burkholderiales bacterium]
MKASTLLRTPVALAAALVMAATAYPAFAQTKSDSTPATPAATTQAATTAQAAGDQAKQPKLSAQDRDLMKLSNDGFATMRAVRAARISIFEGNPKVAHDMVAAAETSLKAAAKDATAFHADQKGGTNQSANEKADNSGYVPIDGQITLVDSFIDTPAKKGHVEKANENIAKGKSKEAMDELKLAEVDAAFTRVLMPLQATQKHVDSAAKLIDQKKFYEANLALKAAEDGLILDTIALSETPKAGAKDKATNPSSPASQQNATGTQPKS